MWFVSVDMTRTCGGHTSTHRTQPLQVSVSMVTVAGCRGMRVIRNTRGYGLQRREAAPGSLRAPTRRVIAGEPTRSDRRRYAQAAGAAGASAANAAPRARQSLLVSI